MQVTEKGEEAEGKEEQCLEAAARRAEAGTGQEARGTVQPNKHAAYGLGVL